MMLFRGRTRYRNFTLGIEGLHGADRTEKNWRFPSRPKQFDRRIELLDVNQAPRTNLNMLVGSVVQANGCIVVDSRSEIREMPRRKFLAGHGFEFRHIQGLFGARNRLRG